MTESESFGSFFKENKKLVREYVEIHLERYKLKLIQVFSKSAGFLFWIIISLFLFLLFSIFFGLVIGFWLSEITGSYILGFGITTIIIALKILLLTAFRKKLFVDPIIRNIIDKVSEQDEFDEN
jgi:hypothetical protein